MTTVITPSKPDYWRGTASGGNLTIEQLNAVREPRMAARIARYRRGGGMQTYTVSLFAKQQRLEDIPRKVHFVCPVAAQTKDGKRLCVIAPNGMEAWVDAK